MIDKLADLGVAEVKQLESMVEMASSGGLIVAARTRARSSKFQIPNPKQAPKGQKETRALFGALLFLSAGACLELSAWNLELPTSYVAGDLMLEHGGSAMRARAGYAPGRPRRMGRISASR
jgi:hypothetical protein